MPEHENFEDSCSDSSPVLMFSICFHLFDFFGVVFMQVEVEGLVSLSLRGKNSFFSA